MKNPFVTLESWTLEVLDTIKKDLKSDHLPTDPDFHRTYFGNRPQNRLGAEELLSAYKEELLKGNEELSEFVVNRWVFKNGDLYEHFADRLSAINPEFDEITTLSEEESEQILKGSADKFGAASVYLFSVLNRVAFPQAVVEKLRKDADKERSHAKKRESALKEQESFDKQLAAKDREIARLNDKISGVQKKYTTDVEALKKQVRSLQQKLAGK